MIIIKIIIAVLALAGCFDVWAEYRGHQDYIQDRKAHFEKYGKKLNRKIKNQIQ